MAGMLERQGRTYWRSAVPPPAIAHGPDLAEELFGVGAAVHPALRQVDRVAVQRCGALDGAVVDKELFGIAGASEPADSVATDPQLAGDRAQRPALSDQIVDGGMPTACPLRQPSVSALWGGGGFRICRRSGRLAVPSSWRPDPASAIARNHAPGPTLRRP
jgi:hypothetical protein